MRQPVPILMLHGQPGGARDWDRVRAEPGPTTRVLVPARPGYDRRSPAGGIADNAAAGPTTIVLGTRDSVLPPCANRRLARQIPAATAARAPAATVQRRSGAPSPERQELRSNPEATQV